jgi:orotate phosphoribosyltransferase
MKFAADKYPNLVRILDVKHGDIMATQEAWAVADHVNYNPDIVTLNGYMGGEDVTNPYLNDPNVGAFVLAATSNPGATELQNLVVGGIPYYAEVARQAHGWNDSDRIGFVVGATKPEEMRTIREVEAEYGLDPAMVLAPGFGKQGGSLSFVSIAGPNAVYPISSDLTKEKRLNGRTPTEAAKDWRDTINAELENAEEIPTITQHVVDNMIKEGLIVVPTSTDIATWPFLKKGRKKLEAAGIELINTSQEDQQEQLRSLLADGTLDKSDFTDIFMDIRHVSKSPETQRLLAFLYKKMINESGVEYDRIGSIPYGATKTADLVSEYLDKPSFMLRKERGAEATHDDIVGELNPGDRAIMIEDVTTSAGSLVKDVEELREKYDAEIGHAFVFVKRTPEGEQNCRDHGIDLHYILDMEQLRQMVASSKSVLTVNFR